jgi:hypothetical protein
VRSLSGLTQVDNAGTILGNVRFAPGAGSVLNNLAGGTLLAGSSLDLGAASNVLSNAGTLASGAARPATTAINGSLVQGAGGRLSVRIDTNASLADRFVLTGSARVAGEIAVTPLSAAVYRPGEVSAPFLTAAGGADLSGAVVTGGTAILGYGVVTGAGGATLVSTTDYTPAGLSASGNAIGERISAIELTGGSPLMDRIVAALVAIPDIPTLNRAYETVGGEGVTAIPQVTFAATQMAMNMTTDRMDAWRLGGLDAQRAASRSDLVQAGGGMRKPLRMWISMMASHASNQGLSGSSFGGAVGVDGELMDGAALVGVALNLSQSWFSNSAPSSSINATNFGLSGYAVGRFGQGYLSGIAYIGGNGAGYDRDLYALGLNLQTSTHINSTVAAGRIEGGWRVQIAESPLHLTPYLAIQPTQIWQGGASEGFGAVGAGLTYQGNGITALPMNLGFQLDAKWKLTDADEESLETWLRLAWMHDFLPNRSVSRGFAELAGQPLSTPGNWNVPNAAVVRAGVNYRLDRQSSLFGSLDATLSPTWRSVGGVFGYRRTW